MTSRVDAQTKTWAEYVDLNGHTLVVDPIGQFTLDDEAADTDPTVVEDEATLYAVECLTCRQVAGAQPRVEVAHFAVNRRTGEWLGSWRTGLDDQSLDTVALIVEHCRPCLVSRPEFPGDCTAPLGYGDTLEIDAEALAAARLLTGFGRSPWEALGVYRDILHGNPASAS